MNSPVPQRQASLAHVLGQRLAIAALAAVILQIGATAVRNYFDEIDLNTNYVKYEARQVATAYQSAAPNTAETGHWLPARYRGSMGKSYGFRILDARGRVLAQQNGALLSALSPWRFPLSETQDFWLRRLDSRSWMQVAGGVHLTRETSDLWVEVATLGDPASAHVGIFARELVADVWLPMIVLVSLMLGVAVVTVRRALSPLVEAADRADGLTALDRSERLDVDRLPREAASLAAAINRLLDRTAELVTSQRLFLARAAHELRTPLSIMLLELGRNDGPRIPRLEGDVRAMTEMVDRLLTLAKLESVEKPEFSEIDLCELARAIVAGMSEWALQSGHRIVLVADAACVIRGDKFALREAIRNLVENAVKHSPENTDVRVVTGPGPRIAVEDSGLGIDPEKAHDLIEPFARGNTNSEGAGLGLAIVAQAAAMHGATLKIKRSTLGGASFEIDFARVGELQRL